MRRIMARVEKIWKVVSAVALAVVIGTFQIVKGETGEEKHGFIVTGRVVMPDGSPAVGASVEAYSWQDWSGPSGATKTDTAGRFEISLGPGEYWFRVKAGNFSNIDYSRIQIHEDGSVSCSPEIHLKEGCVVQGKVTDKTTGKPVSEALIVTDDGDRTVTGVDGTFRLEGILKKDHAIIAAKEGLYWPVVYFDTTGRTSVEILFETKPGGTIKGVVTNEKGEPIAGAVVRDYRSGSIWICGLRKMKTNEKGEYFLSGYDPDQRVWSIGVEASGYSKMSKNDIQFPIGQREVMVNFKLSSNKNVADTSAVSGGTTTKNLRKIFGRVVRESGNPVKGALVAYGNSTSYVGYKSTETNEDGKYILEGVENRDDTVAVQAYGFEPEFKRAGTTDDVQLDFVLKPGHWLEGRIVDNEGKPVAGIHVSVMAECKDMIICDRTYRYLRPQTTTDAEGRFGLKDLPAERVIIDAYSSGYSKISKVTLEVDKNDHILTILPPGQISGTVLQANNGKPVSQFKVFLGFPEKREPGDKSSGFSAAYSSSGVSFNSTEGTFTISELNTQDTLRIIIDAPGFYREAIDRVIVQPLSKIDYSALTFRLHPASVFEGFVTEIGTGKGIEDVLVTLLDTGVRGLGSFSWTNPRKDFHPISVRTDVDGKFKIESVPIRRGIVLLEKNGFARTLLRDVDFSQPLKASVAKGGMIRGTVTDNTGSPLAGVKIDAYLEGNISFGHTGTDENGYFCFTDLPSGEYQVLQLEGNRWARLHDVNLSHGEDYTVDWNRPGEAEIEGTVMLKGVLVSGIEVMLHPVGKSKMSAPDKTKEDGRYHLSVTKSGKYRISFQKGDWMDPNKIYFRKTVMVEAGKNRFDITLPGASISGKVIDQKTREPVANTKVRAYIKQSEQEVFGEDSWSSQHILPYWFPKNEAKTDANGRFEMDNMAVGEWLIAVEESERKIRIHGQPFYLKENEKKHDIALEIPDVGSASILVIDTVTNETVSDVVFLECADESGFNFYPEMEEGKRKSKLRPGGKILFTGLTPGRYKVFAMGKVYPTISMEFVVQPGKQSDAIVKMKAGGRIGFRLLGTSDDPLLGIPWIGFRINQPGNPEPVLRDARGLFWGSIIFLEGDPPRQAFIPVEPGEYLVDAVLRRENQTGVISAKDDLWGGKQTVNVEEGKDTIIDISWER